MHRAVGIGMVVVGLAAFGQERGLPPAPPPGGIVRTPGQPVRVEAPVVEAGVEVPVRRGTATAFGERVVVEVRGLAVAAADAALREAVAEIVAVEALVDAGGDGGVAELNAAAGAGPRAVDGRLAEILARALRFCDWSRGAHGPLGGRLDQVWGLDGDGGRGIPAPAEVRQAAGAASCDGLSVDDAAGTASLAPGRRVALRGFARGFAVDRAVEVLRRHGAEDLYVEVGGVRRAAGGGPHGSGWPVALPAFAGMARPLGPLHLRDRALAVVSAGERPLVVGGDRHARWLDQRSGRPAEGVVATLAASELAADAEALAVVLTVLGNREGMLRLGGLEPAPSVLWLLGGGDGPPLEAPYRWTGF